ncbi:MAG TPA: DNA-processing protein DprA [Flavihumibacter sp.]|jgi:DNA processing protein
MEEEQICLVALTKIPTIGYVHAKLLLDRFGSATAIFNASLPELQHIEGIGEIRAKNIRQFDGFRICSEIVRQSIEHGIEIIGYGDSRYPSRLKECYDPPVLLYYKGEAPLDLPKSVAIIGTRSHTEYGRQVTERITRELAQQSIAVVSGMAYGIDGLAHRTAMQHGAITIGVLAHGLDHIYPSVHTGLGKEILRKGGALVTEFPIGTKAERHHFPIRNRIVAGISQAVIIVETGLRGGSMITAALANSYNVPVFAVPGRITDPTCSGSNRLIRDQKAIAYTGLTEFLMEMQWNEGAGKKETARQLPLLTELDLPSGILVNLLSKHSTLPVSDLYILSGLEAGTAAKAILDLELNGLVKVLPGRRYTLAK